MRTIERLSDLQSLIGQEVAVSDWVLVDQARINRFADATGDHQWIHIDPERAAQGPFKTTIAHGFLTLSLIPSFSERALSFPNVRMGVNYGLNKVRFTSPVPVNSRLRGRYTLLACEPIEGNGTQLTWKVTIEREGSERPVCIAESLARFFE